MRTVCRMVPSGFTVKKILTSAEMPFSSAQAGYYGTSRARTPRVFVTNLGVEVNGLDAGRSAVAVANFVGRLDVSSASSSLACGTNLGIFRGAGRERGAGSAATFVMCLTGWMGTGA